MSHDSHEDEHGDGDHGIHLPDPSMWPLVVGAASLFLGLALVWWSGDPNNPFTGPFLGAAVVFTLISAGGWAYEDGRMRKKAEEGEVKARKSPRFTQVITFTIADGQSDTARSAGGVLAALETSEMVVKDLAGFQDYRVTVSPGSTGPLQVLAETTWSDRDGLNTYDSAQTTLLDVINSHNEEIIPGSVQAFDMEVVRDTKETAFSMSKGAVLALLGSFIVGGFMVGAGLNLFASDAVAGETVVEAGPPQSPTAPVVEARDNVFVQKELKVTAGADIAVTFTNRGNSPHNITFFESKGGPVIGGTANGNIAPGGATLNFSFKAPAVGSYYYHCDLHPEQMTGTLIAEEGAAAPPPAAGGSPAASPAATR